MSENERCAVEGCADEPTFEVHFSQSWFLTCRYHAAQSVADDRNGEVSAIWRDGTR